MAGQERDQADNATVSSWEATDEHTNACRKRIHCENAHPCLEAHGTHQAVAIFASGSASGILEHDFGYFSSVRKVGSFPAAIDRG